MTEDQQLRERERQEYAEAQADAQRTAVVGRLRLEAKRRAISKQLAGQP